jgi:hypothetical protein
MRKLYLLAFATLAGITVFAQDSHNEKMGTSAITGSRSSDHFLFQVSSDRWMGAPDSINNKMKATSRGANVYFMIDKQLKGNPKFSVGIGLGVGTSHYFMDKMSASINGTSQKLKFNNLDTSNHFSKYKVSTSFLEIPLELRYYSKPNNTNKSFKFAAGVKVGTLINAHTKGKTLLNSNGTKIQEYTEKITSKNYFNTTRIAGTVRIGYGSFSVFGAYNFTSIFKDNLTTNMKLFQAGLTISGL